MSKVNKLEQKPKYKIFRKPPVYERGFKSITYPIRLPKFEVFRSFSCQDMEKTVNVARFESLDDSCQNWYLTAFISKPVKY